ncbi:MAG: type II/IV secretion system ATPase subunit [Candidatus Aenigmarchaeota archaeon]|nr:type II/IV secretion system ATPase subunit [Candidatus Aenigmarchaeota archaeon]
MKKAKLIVKRIKNTVNEDVEVEDRAFFPEIDASDVKLKEKEKKIMLRFRPKPQSKKEKQADIKTTDAKTLDIGMLQQLLKMQKKPKKKKIKVEGIEIPENKVDVKLPEFETKKLANISIKYPLIPPSSKGRVFASANIFWDDIRHEFVYRVMEPELSKENAEILKKVKEFIQEKINIDFTKLRKIESIRYISNMFDDALNYFKVVKTPETKEILKYYIFRDFIGLGKIEPLLKDPNIEDISCDGVGVPIYVYHKDSRFGSLRTNILFKTKRELDNFVMKLAERCGKTVSIANPLLDGVLPDGSRVQTTLESDIARRGSNFTIRKFSEKPLTPVDLLKFGTVNLTQMAYFWLAIEYGSSIFVSGGTASGKTTLLNVLSFFIKPQLKIVSIEDTAELRLAHPHWVPQIARVPIAAEKKDIDLYELLKESLRQRPDYIIVGEVRGREAYVLFQQIALGHGGLATIHAENFSKLVDRLTTPPISLHPSLLQNLDLVIFIERRKRKEKYLRRVTAVDEIIGYDKETKTPIWNEIFEWDAMHDKFQIKNRSYLLKKIAVKYGMKEIEIRNEINDRTKVLCWLVKRHINDYRKITAIINLFYVSRDYLLERIEKEI